MIINNHIFVIRKSQHTNLMIPSIDTPSIWTPTGGVLFSHCRNKPKWTTTSCSKDLSLSTIVHTNTGDIIDPNPTQPNPTQHSDTEEDMLELHQTSLRAFEFLGL